jgi:hypothetical protein
MGLGPIIYTYRTSKEGVGVSQKKNQKKAWEQL